MKSNLAIATLIQSRMTELGLSRGEFAKRLGYKNIAQGIRRIDALCEGDPKRWVWFSVNSKDGVLTVFGVYRCGSPLSQTFQKKRLGISRVYNAWRILACGFQRKLNGLSRGALSPVAGRHCYISGHSNHRFRPKAEIRLRVLDDGSYPERTLARPAN